MVTCLYTPRLPLYSEVPRGHDLLSSCVHVSSLVFQYRVLPGLLLPSQSCLDGQVTLRQVRGLWCSACTVQREELWMGRKQWNYFQNQKFSPLSLGNPAVIRFWGPWFFLFLLNFSTRRSSGTNFVFTFSVCMPYVLSHVILMRILLHHPGG